MKDDIRDIVRRFLMKEKIKDLKRKQRDMELRYAIRQAKEHQAELEKRFNHNHDPKNGRFTSGLTSSGGGGTIPVRDCAKIRQLTEIDDIAAHILVKGFVEPDLTNHWEGSDHAHSHKDQYKGMTKEQYAQRAKELAEMPVGGNIRGFVILNQNVIVRYDVKTNDFVKVHIHQGVITMFKPTNKIAYFSSRFKDEMNSRPRKKKRK